MVKIRALSFVISGLFDKESQYFVKVSCVISKAVSLSDILKIQYLNTESDNSL
jgi:hypothetical protein